MKKILIVNTSGFGYEGISSVIINYLSHMDRRGMEFTFITKSDIPADYKKILTPLGTIVAIPNRKQNMMDYIAELKKILKENKFDVIHIHGNSGTMAIEAFLARWYHIKKIIVHTHNMHCDYPFLNWILTPAMKALSSDLLACSAAAGKWLYGKNFTVLNNAIDIKRFCFRQQSRNECRKELGLPETAFVIGHVGNFLPQKNHSFLIDVFVEYRKTDSNARLLLVGDGPDLEKIKQKVFEYCISDAVVFTGQRKNVEQLYCAMDVFVFPSLWEGLGMVVIEAQASGLKCVVSNNVPNEARVSDNIEYLSLEQPPEQWSKHIMQYAAAYGNRGDMSDLTAESIRTCGYDIEKEANKLQKIYLQ